ncbi:MAG: hypothetical protein ACI84D_002502 [Thalassolituus oleivorans]|jgi:hypothetical protein
MTLEWFDLPYWAWRLPAGEAGPVTAFTVMRTPDETTVITTDASPPAGARVSGPWTMFRIAEELPHDAIGILAALSRVLADAQIPILAFGSFDTDYVLIPSETVERGRGALVQAGYTHK